MRARTAALKRVLRVYSALEEVRSEELLRAGAAVDEVEQAITAQIEAALHARQDGQFAIRVEDRAGQRTSSVLQGAASVLLRRLEPVRAQRQQQGDLAREKYVEIRMKREQIQRLAERAEARIEVEEERRMQAASDDRFLARRWNERLAGMKDS